VDYEKPGLEILKKNIATGEPIEGVTYLIEQIDGSYSTSATTDNHGRIFLESIPVGSYKVTEINVPNHVILCPIPQEAALKPGETSTDIAPGTTLVIKETRAKAGYILDDTPQTVKVKSNEVVTVEFRNQPKGNLIIVKQDSVTKEPLERVEFKITYADGSYIDAEGGTLSSNGLYWTDKEGKITISGISGTIVPSFCRERENSVGTD